MDGIGFGFGIFGGVVSYGAALSDALAFLDGADGMALLFDSEGDFDTSGFPGSAAIVGGGTQDGYDTSPDTAAASLLTYTSPSVKMVMGPSGTLRFGAHNLCLQSSDISNLSWTKADATAPDATTLQETATTAAHHVGQVFTLMTGATYTCSVDLKYTSRQWINVALYVGGADYNHRAFDVLNGVEGLSNGPEFVSSSMISLGDGWYRCTVVCAAAAGTTGVLRIVMAQSNSTSYLPSYAGNTANQVSIRNAHLRRTPSDSTYLATTSAARYALPLEWNTAGVLQGLRPEEARTNLALQSQDAATTWAVINSAVTTNTQTSPDGTTTADTLRATGGAGTSCYLYQIVTIVSGSTYALSAYVKKGTYRYPYLNLQGFNANEWVTAVFDLDGGGSTATQTSGGSTSGTVISTSQESVGNGWYRLSLVFSITETNSYFVIGFAPAATGNSFTSGGQITGTWATTETLYVWGMQLELGSFATSYIPTIGSTVTRAADSGLTLATSAYPHSATVNTAMIEYVPDNVATAMVALRWDDGTSNEVVRVGHDASANLGLTVTDGGAAQTAPLTSGTVTAGATKRVAVSWKANDFLISNAGAASAADTSGTVPTVTSLDFGPTLTGVLKKVVVFNAEYDAAALETLATA